MLDQAIDEPVPVIGGLNNYTTNRILIGLQVVLNDLNRNRRGDESVDRELTVTRIDDLNDEPVVVLVNWTAHPTIMDEHDMWVSGGWPGYLQRELEAWIGNDVVAMYYNGAEGDQSTAGLCYDFRLRPSAGIRGTLRQPPCF